MTPAQRKIRRWRENPKVFVHEELKVETIDAWQQEGLEALADPNCPRISFQACAGPGKTAVLAWSGWWFLTTQADKGEHPKGAAVSITASNLSDNLWAEYSKWQGRSEFLKAAFEWTHSKIYAKDFPETWFLSSRSFSQTANAEKQGATLSGLHSEFPFCQIDESGEIPTTVLRAGEQALSNCRFGKIMQAGNPTSQDGMLHAAATELADQWKVIRITGDPDDPRRSPRIDIEWARRQIKQYGRTNPWVMAYILGQFPQGSLNTLLGPDEVEVAMRRHYREPDYQYAQKRLGVDVARYGDDSTILAPRQGLVAFDMEEMKNASTPDIAGRVMQAHVKWDHEEDFVDGTGGYGAGVIDALIQAGYSPHEINFSGRALDPRYFNKRTEIHFLLAEWVKQRGALPHDPQLKKELTTPRYYFQGGKIRLEEKDQIKKRLGFSPDRADALALTFSMPEMPSQRGLFPGLPTPKRIKSDYDPFDDSRS